ncbi:PQQ-dependent sugar dehydrogenase [Gynuella sp.]|uniref:PQQ-dependent sugar dehydrogenase n=1 Tax=Gynuella sp. TaxID=2969146 RepID=UPI003D0FDB3C
MKYCIVVLMVFLSAAVQSKVQNYLTNGMCDGYPRAAIDTEPGVCIGLVHQGKPLVKPRRIIEWRPGTLLITDMGGWGNHRGTLWRYDVKSKSFEALLEHLNLPHGLERLNDSTILVGEKDRLLRVTLDDSAHVLQSEELMTRKIIDGHRHPLMNFTLLQDKTLVLNFGAPTDQCKAEVAKGVCAQRQTDAQLRWYTYDEKTEKWDFDHYRTTKGLRNSMALAVNRFDKVFQADNGMDFKRVFSPLETLNQVSPDQDYGWPYCFPVQQVNPLWSTIKPVCRSYDSPVALLPPHGAPLDMMFYEQQALPALTNTLLISLHGYQVSGHQLLALKLDKHQQPIIHDGAYYSRDPREQEFGRQQESYPSGYGPEALEVIHRWDQLEGVRPKGNPVGLTASSDGTVWVIEDNNRSLLRLAPGKAFVSENLWQQDRKIMPPENVSQVLASECQACHEQLSQQVSEYWLTSGLMYQKVVKDRRMPPQGFSDPAKRQLIESWLDQVGKP